MQNCHNRLIDAAEVVEAMLQMRREMEADVVLVDLNTPFAMPVHKPVSALVYNAGYGSVDTVIVDGKLLMRGKRVLCVDEAALLAEARQVCGRLFERAGVSVGQQLPLQSHLPFSRNVRYNPV